jgi:hypothetical protein
LVVSRVAAIERNCDQCGDKYEAKRATSRFCSPKCRAAHRRNPAAVEVVDSTGDAHAIEPGLVSSQLEATLTAAKDRLKPEDAAAVAVLRMLAVKMDQFAAALAVDKDTPALFLRYCDALGLTPAARSKLTDKKEPTGGRLGNLRSVPRPQSA